MTDITCIYCGSSDMIFCDAPGDEEGSEVEFFLCGYCENITYAYEALNNRIGYEVEDIIKPGEL